MYKVVRFGLLIGLSTILMFGLSACGSSVTTSTTSTTSSTSNTSGSTTPSTDVALASAGATVTTSYAGNENYVINGDTSTTNYWQAGTSGDWLLIDFGKAYTIDSVKITATNLNSNTDFTMEYSADNVTYTSINTFSDCSSLHLGSTYYSCTFNTPYNARYFRFTSKNTASQIHEISVMGK